MPTISIAQGDFAHANGFLWQCNLLSALLAATMQRTRALPLLKLRRCCLCLIHRVNFDATLLSSLSVEAFIKKVIDDNFVNTCRYAAKRNRAKRNRVYLNCGYARLAKQYCEFFTILHWLLLKATGLFLTAELLPQTPALNITIAKIGDTVTTIEADLKNVIEPYFFYREPIRVYKQNNAYQQKRRNRRNNLLFCIRTGRLAPQIRRGYRLSSRCANTLKATIFPQTH